MGANRAKSLQSLARTDHSTQHSNHCSCCPLQIGDELARSVLRCAMAKSSKPVASDKCAPSAATQLRMQRSSDKVHAPEKLICSWFANATLVATLSRGRGKGYCSAGCTLGHWRPIIMSIIIPSCAEAGIGMRPDSDDQTDRVTTVSDRGVRCSNID